MINLKSIYNDQVLLFNNEIVIRMNKNENVNLHNQYHEQLNDDKDQEISEK